MGGGVGGTRGVHIHEMRHGVESIHNHKQLQ